MDAEKLNDTENLPNKRNQYGLTSVAFVCTLIAQKQPPFRWAGIRGR